jgi:hypothetical protein
MCGGPAAQNQAADGIVICLVGLSRVLAKGARPLPGAGVLSHVYRSPVRLGAPGDRPKTYANDSRRGPGRGPGRAGPWQRGPGRASGPASQARSWPEYQDTMNSWERNASLSAASAGPGQPSPGRGGCRQPTPAPGLVAGLDARPAGRGSGVSESRYGIGPWLGRGSGQGGRPGPG